VSRGDLTEPASKSDLPASVELLATKEEHFVLD